MSNVNVYILNQDKQLLPIGIPGELYISGAGVARGYLNQPEMTAEKFLPDPFNPGERMYKTGDLAKWLPDGNIEYLGRIDNQVKIRGYRIELDEIESRLTRISQIKEAVVTAPKDAMGTRYLCAYVVSDKKLHVAELKVELGQVLPSYMIPTRFIQLEKLPLTTNGKVDRKNLPEPTETIDDETNYMAPRTDIEKQLVEIWSDVLQIRKIGILDNFFEVGGHSLKATILTSRISKNLHVSITLQEIFENPTIKSISQIIEKKVKEHYMPILPVKEQDYYAASSAQKRLLIINQLESTSVTYNMPGAFILAKLRSEQLHEAFKKLIIRHESLRTSFSWLDGEPIQEIHQSAELDLQYNKCAEIEISEKIKQFIKPFDLSIAPLLRVEVWNIGLDKHMLLFDMHHIISDGISINILTKELKEFYEGNELPALAIQYKDYTAWQNEQYQTLTKN
ncbi:Carrier domain-containing protein OS=Lysinibacillus sphaericus OX=1421 GN=LS41612_16120 PE=3 SV=1 [Lysinibacillus sphaericus]